MVHRRRGRTSSRMGRLRLQSLWSRRLDPVLVVPMGTMWRVRRVVERVIVRVNLTSCNSSNSRPLNSHYRQQPQRRQVNVTQRSKVTLVTTPQTAIILQGLMLLDQEPVHPHQRDPLVVVDRVRCHLLQRLLSLTPWASRLSIPMPRVVILPATVAIHSFFFFYFCAQ